MYSTFSKGKSVIAERFIKILKNKIYKYMTAIGKNVYFAILNEKLLKKILNLKQVIMSEFQSTKIFLRKDIHLIGAKKSL